jgi:hypothetical protein
VFAVLAIILTLAGSLVVFVVGDLIEGRMAATALAVVIGLIIAGSFVYAYVRA